MKNCSGGLSSTQNWIPAFAGMTEQGIFLKTTHKIITWFAGVFLLVTVGVVVSFWTFKQVEESTKIRDHTYAVLNGAVDFMSALKDAESGQRGYLLTGDEAYLAHYSRERDSITADLAKLRQLTLLPTAQQHLDALVPLVAAKLVHMSEIIALRRERDMAGVAAEMRTGQGLQLMDAIRAEMTGFIRLEEALLLQHEADFQSNMRLMFTLIVSTSMLALLFAVFFAYLIYRETRQQLKNLVHIETGHLLAAQEALNAKLQQANTTLQVSEAKLAVTLNSIGDAVIATDAEACVTFLNPVAEELTGWTETEASGRPVLEVFHIINQETRQPATLPVIATLAHGTIQGMANHTILIAKDGSERAIADSCAPIRGPAGNVVGAVLVFRDVTQEYAVQQALHDNATLIQTILEDKNTALEAAMKVADKANLAKTDFLSSMSHELRTPLNAILGFAQLMQSGTPLPTLPQQQSIEHILKAGWYLLDLINEILDLALIESGKMTVSREPVSLDSTLIECRAMVEPQAQKRDITMTFSHLDCGYFVNADRTRLKQVLINLLFNAIKYNRPGGAVVVSCSLDAATPQRLRISVRDTGAGLTPYQLTQLFQPFNRLGKESSAEEGTGIGLVVTKRLVELMGGAVGVDSSVGVGSVFWVELNMAKAPGFVETDADQETTVTARSALAAVGLPSMPQRTVLYVEDNPANLELVEQLVKRRDDLRLLSAADGHLGIEFARAYLPEVILMDINLPGISGIKAMQILRADPLTAHIPIIAISANAVPSDIEKALDAGFFDYLTKPIKVNLFMDALDAALKVSQTRKSDVM